MQNTTVDTSPKASESSHNTKACPDFPRDLLINEKFWRDLQPYLATRGYMLRPRYHAGWTPSWKVGQFAWSSEDSAMNQLSPIMDATRVSGELVILKRVFSFKHPREVEMTQFFSNEPLRSHPRNHCVTLLDTFEVPGHSGQIDW
ncbi:hypothetical protein C8Q75DRAFT_260268 [Abortiporus biennis]|nr:hypothetical protein C8Q75DRAFT_260268 [Abortiporus biennis]